MKNQSNKKVLIRFAECGDLQRITEIYNEAVLERAYTFDEFHIDITRYSKIMKADSRSFIIVAEVNSVVVGWVSVVPISDRWAYRLTGVDSMFITRNFRRSGVGNSLREAEINEATRIGYRNIIGEVLSTNKESIAFNLKHGYRIVGEINEAGFRDGRWIGLVIMQKNIESEKSMERRVRFTIVTDDFEKSIKLYRDALGLEMRLLSHPIAMFPLGTADFEICDREHAKTFVGIEGSQLGGAGAVLSLKVASLAKAKKMIDAALDQGAEELNNSAVPKLRTLKDFNGLIINIDFVNDEVPAV